MPLGRPIARLRRLAAVTALAGLVPSGVLGADRPGAPVLEMVAASAESYARPHDIVLSPDGERLLVADNDNGRIAVLDAQTLRELGTFGEGELSGPHDVDFDAEGRLLVADTGNARIAIYAVDGAGGRLVGELTGGVRGPEGVLVHPDGRVIATGAWSNNLVVWRDGTVVAETGGFASPHDVEIAPDGTVWVADAANDRMVALDDRMEITRVLAGPPYDFDGPRYMDFDDAGRMYVADKYANRIKILAPDGALLSAIGTADAGKGPNRFDRPEGVEIRGRDVWFSDTYNDRIVRYRIAAGG